MSTDPKILADFNAKALTTRTLAAVGMEQLRKAHSCHAKTKIPGSSPAEYQRCTRPATGTNEFWRTPERAESVPLCAHHLRAKSIAIDWAVLS